MGGGGIIAELDTSRKETASIDVDISWLCDAATARENYLQTGDKVTRRDDNRVPCCK